MDAVRFREIRDQAVAEVDRVFAEPVRISFFAQSRIDPSREMVEIAAVIRAAPSSSRNMQSGPTREWRTQVAPGEANLFIDAATYQGPSIADGDRVCALSRPGQPWWKVVSVAERGQGRLIFTLSEL